MNLILLDERKALLFQMPAEDTTEEKALASLRENHPRWSDAEVRAHLQQAIDAGAYRAEAEEA